jgi:hypothetical protein
MALPNSTTNQPSRFSQVEVLPRGAGGAGHAPTIGAGATVPLAIILPANQTANAIEVRTAAGVLIFKVGPNGGTVINTITAAGAIPVRPSATYTITNAGITALTLAAPTAGADDGVTLTIQSATAFAHTLTATGLLQTGSASVNVATFAAFAGANVRLRAYNGKWMVESSVGITFS